MIGQCCDRGYWAVVSDNNDMAWDIRRTRTEVIKAMAGPEPPDPVSGESLAGSVRRRFRRDRLFRSSDTGRAGVAVN